MEMRKCFSPVRLPKMFLIILLLTAVLLAVHPFYVFRSPFIPCLPLDAFVSSLHCLFMLPSFIKFSLTLHLVGGRGLDQIHFSPFSFSIPFFHSLNLSFSVPATGGGTFKPEARYCPCSHIWFPLLL